MKIFLAVFILQLWWMAGGTLSAASGQVTPAEMAEVWSEFPEALQNTVEIAERCNVDLAFNGYHLPFFPVPEGYTPNAYLRVLCEQGLTQREICRMAGWSESKVSRLLSETMAQIQEDALRALKASDPWLELSWDDLVAMCEVYQNGFF